LFFELFEIKYNIECSLGAKVRSRLQNWIAKLINTLILTSTVWGVIVSDISITYDLLFDILKIEKSREDLQKLDEKFYKNVVEYLGAKESIISNPNTPVRERELTRIQLGNVKKLLLELYDRREKKIINLSIYKIKTGSGIINTDALLEEERYLFDMLCSQLSHLRNNIINNVVEGKTPSIDSSSALDNSHPQSNKKSDEEDDTENVAEGIKSVRFIKSVPKFLGPELEIYGPFEENDIASLPTKIANILVKKDRAEEMQLN
jgi:DNA replication initiation complex subunit (GINS family)